MCLKFDGRNLSPSLALRFQIMMRREETIEREWTLCHTCRWGEKKNLMLNFCCFLMFFFNCFILTYFKFFKFQLFLDCFTLKNTLLSDLPFINTCKFWWHSSNLLNKLNRLFFVLSCSFRFSSCSYDFLLNSFLYWKWHNFTF